MLKDAIAKKKCLIVCGGGGVGKTTVAASLAVAAAKVKKKVLVVTIDPSKRLAEAFGFTERSLIDGGEPLKLSDEVKASLGLSAQADLYVGVLNPRYVLEQIVQQTLTPAQGEKLKRTLLYSNLSNMIYGLQEYTAYEWVTRMIQNGDYDFIVLDTPPAAHAKDFFNVPERVQRLMESKVFQLFMPKKKTWFSRALSFTWIEKLLGEKIYSESRTFFEVFATLRDRVLERCALLTRFFKNEDVAVITVSTTESSGQFELKGLNDFLKQKSIPLESIILNQVEPFRVPDQKFDEDVLNVSESIYEKLKLMRMHQQQKAENAKRILEKTRTDHPGKEVLALPMVYAETGFEILKITSDAISAIL